jgi:hypothetical protein
MLHSIRIIRSRGISIGEEDKGLIATFRGELTDRLEVRTTPSTELILRMTTAEGFGFLGDVCIKQSHIHRTSFSEFVTLGKELRQSSVRD